MGGRNGPSFPEVRVNVAVLTRYKLVTSRFGYRRIFGDLDTMVRTIQSTSLESLYGGFDSIDGRRTYEHWRAQHAVLCDIDTPGGSERPPVTPEQVEAMETRMPSAYPTIWYPSRRGCRVFFVLQEPVTDLTAAKSVCRGAWALLRHVMDGTGLGVDGCTTRPVQLNRGPGTALVRVPGFVWPPDRLALWDPGEQTLAEVQRDLARQRLAAAARDPRDRGRGAGVVWPVPEGRKAGSGEMRIRFDEAAAAWSAAHPVPDLGRPGSLWACPVCNSSNGFGRMGTEGPGNRWVCFSDRHDPDVGRPLTNGGGFWGDALDLASWLRRTTPQDLLVEDGWLAV